MVMEVGVYGGSVKFTFMNTEMDEGTSMICESYESHEITMRTRQSHKFDSRK